MQQWSFKLSRSRCKSYTVPSGFFSSHALLRQPGEKIFFPWNPVYVDFKVINLNFGDFKLIGYVRKSRWSVFLFFFYQLINTFINSPNWAFQN